jgi:hypothetical protein
MRRKVLRRGSVGIRLAFLSRFGVVLVYGSGGKCVVMFLEMLIFRGVRVLARGVMLILVMRFVLVELLVVRFLVVFSGAGQ